MNERIRELAEQARDYARNYVADCKQYGYYMEYNELELRFEEKFAELIVKECTDLFEVEYGQSEVSGNEIANVLKRHFGVEDE